VGMAVMVDDRVQAFASRAHRRFHPHAAGLGFVGVRIEFVLELLGRSVTRSMNPQVRS
jgi:hypothetical protein